MGFKQVFDTYGCFEETDPVSRRLRFEPLFLDLCNVKELLRMISRFDLLWKSYLVCSNFSESYDIA